MEKFYLIIEFSLIAIFIISGLMMVSYLNKKGEKIKKFLLSLYIIPNANKYKKLTKEETGKTGYLFYLWIISINCALIFIVLFMLYSNY